MANLKNITELPVAESAEGLNLIVNDNGAAKQIAANSVVGKVKTVNGAEPDENGNVEIDIPEGFSGSWNDLSDKPFGDGEEITILERATYEGFFNPEADFNVLEESFQLDVVVGDNINVFWDGEIYSCQVMSHNNENMYFGNPKYHTENDNGLPFIFDWSEAYGWIPIAYGDLSVTSHTFGITKVSIKKIDPKYLHDGVSAEAIFTAQTTAETAQAAAETAQTTAETAQPLTLNATFSNYVYSATCPHIKELTPGLRVRIIATKVISNDNDTGKVKFNLNNWGAVRIGRPSTKNPVALKNLSVITIQKGVPIMLEYRPSMNNGSPAWVTIDNPVDTDGGEVHTGVVYTESATAKKTTLTSDATTFFLAEFLYGNTAENITLNGLEVVDVDGNALPPDKIVAGRCHIFVHQNGKYVFIQ